MLSLLVLFAASAAALPCLLGPSSWTGGSVTISVSAETAAGAFTATAPGAWANAPGVHYPNSTVWLAVDGSAGIFGSVNSACTRILWSDGVGSVWTRPIPPVRRNVTISNLAPRVDDTGAILRVQDGCLSTFQLDGATVFWLTGARYQCCDVSLQAGCYSPCGWRNTTFAVYSSRDLEVWHLESEDIFPIVSDPESPHSNARNAYFEPCVMYSRAADHYVLWFLNTNTKAVAVSDSPRGPFESVSWDVGLAQGSDTYFWEDAATGEVYAKHNGPPPPGEERGAHYVSRLTPDLLAIAPGATSGPMMVPALPVPPVFQGKWPTCSEGGGIFEAGGRWYVMAGVCCCFCHDGANAFVWISDAGPLGPYELQNSTSSSGLLGDVIPYNASRGVYLTGAQQFGVAQIQTTAGAVPVYIGQRFGSADDGLKCHDYQFWSPLTILPGGNVAEMAWSNDFVLEIDVTPMGALGTV